MKIVNIEPINFSHEAKEILYSSGDYKELSLENLINGIELENANVMIVRLGAKIDKVVMNKMPELKYISSATTGLDHIDIEEAIRRGITVLSLKGEESFLDSIPSTAEHSFGLILSLLRNIPSSFNSVISKVWNRDLFKGNQLKGKNLGIIGLGRIGRKVASYGKNFDMNVGFVDVKNLEDFNYPYQKFDNLEDMLPWADIISIHVHLTDANRNLLNSTNLRLMKQGSWLINTSRGGIVDESEIAILIKQGTLKGVAVDVLSNELEKDIFSNPLWCLAKEGYNVIITPHIGGATYEAMHACEIFMAQKLKYSLRNNF